jgi:ubiquinone/menaquinone biosynthesis C-methylase UbiE
MACSAVAKNVDGLTNINTESKMDEKYQYNDFAKEYSESFLRYNANSIEAYFRYLKLNLENKKVLDLGCGDGYDLSEMKQQGALIFGIDSSEEMVALAVQKNPEGMIKVGSFDNIPFSDQAFDVVISKWAFQAAGSLAPIYEEIARVLKPGGTLIYLAAHPIWQFVGKKQNGKDYFKNEKVTLLFFDGQMSETGTSHTFNEYFSPTFFSNFTLEKYEEGLDHGAEKINGDTYPSYFIVQARLKKK